MSHHNLTVGSWYCVSNPTRVSLEWSGKATCSRQNSQRRRSYISFVGAAPRHQNATRVAAEQFQREITCLCRCRTMRSLSSSRKRIRTQLEVNDLAHRV
jgi:hypothetical protein